MKAFIMIRDQPHYRRDAFTSGLKRAGFQVIGGQPDRTKAGDVLTIWNRYGEYNQIASRFERAGGTVFVAENGYLGVDASGIQHYALAVHGHNGSGWWPTGEEKRFERLGIEPKPWRQGGDHIYVRGQRGIGAPNMANPPNWHRSIADLLRRRTSRPVRVMEHPGKPACDPAQAAHLSAALAGAYACVVWSSASGVRALVEGIPVFYDAPHWVCAGAARRGIAMLEQPLMDGAARGAALERMAWAQWSVAEIATGEPFVRLLECDRAQRGPETAAEVKTA